MPKPNAASKAAIGVVYRANMDSGGVFAVEVSGGNAEINFREYASRVSIIGLLFPTDC
jgi:hypothetical protein